MEKITIKQIEKYFKEEKLTLRHETKMLKYAANETAKEFGADAWSVLMFMIKNKPMTGTHSYGFHTALGREIRGRFGRFYHSK